MTVDQFRGMLLAPDGAVEGEHMGHPDFRVKGKIFATLWPKQSRGVLKLPLLEQDAALARNPAAYSLLGKPSQRGWTNVHLNHVELEDVRELAYEAWAEVSAPRPGRR